MPQTRVLAASAAVILALTPLTGAAQSRPLERLFTECVSRGTDPATVPLLAATWMDVAARSTFPESDPSYTLWALADTVPRADGRLGPMSLPMAYRTVLLNHEAPLPVRDPAALRRERRAMDVLVGYRPWPASVIIGRGPGHPSSRLLAYRHYASEHRRLEELLARYAATPDREQLAGQLARLDRDWELFGFKKQVDEAFEIVDAVHASSPGYWQQIGRAFTTAERSTMNGNRYFPTVAVPPYAEWGVSEGWLACSSQDGTQTFEYKVVQIRRPWFDRAAVFSREWRWAAGSPYSDALIADGSGGTSATPGWMPLVPESLVLVRDASIDFAEGVRMTTSAAPRLGGWLVSRSPKSPDPRPGLSWPSDGVVSAPVRAHAIVAAAIGGFSWTPGHFGTSQLHRYVLPPNPAVVVQRSSEQVGAVIGLGLGPTLRGTGAVVGLSVPLFKSPFFALGGVRFPLASQERFRFVVGAGVRVRSRSE